MTRGEHQHFFDWTDLCRAAAATLVVVSHVRETLMIDYGGQRLWLPCYAATSLGHTGVILFFVLSGFWISRSVLQRIDDRSFWPGYLIDRLSRLGIVLVPALVLGGLLDAVGAGLLHLPIYQGMTGAPILANVASRLTLPVFLGNLAFLQTIALAPWGSNAPLWSLAYEFWYYIWFPALVLLLGRRRLSLALVTLLIGAANPAMYLGFASWLVGFALLLRIDAAPAGPMGRGRAYLAAGLFAAVLLAAAMIRQAWTDLALAVSFAVLLLALARSALPLPRFLAPVAYFGRKASFSLYTIHFPIVALVGGWVIGPARLAPSGWSLLLVLALTVFCIAAAWLFALGSEALTPQLRGWLRQRLLAPAQPERA